MGTCRKCNTEKVATDFYANDRTCKDCRKVIVRENRLANVEYYRAHDRSRANRPDRVAARDQYRQTEAGKMAVAKARRNYIEKSPEKRAAQAAVYNAIRDGKLHRSPCCMAPGCFSTHDIQAHHHDYQQPLDVNWLCGKCHYAVHKQHREKTREA